MENGGWKMSAKTGAHGLSRHSHAKAEVTRPTSTVKFHFKAISRNRALF